MKKLVSILLCLVLFLSAAGCSAKEPETSAPRNLMIANPWIAYDTLKDAECAVGFSLSLPEQLAGYQAESFRVMASKLIEVVYRDDSYEITVRKQAGEDLDISGDYRTYEDISITEENGCTVTTKITGSQQLTLVSCGGYSYSLSAPNGYRDETLQIVLNYIVKEKQ